MADANEKAPQAHAKETWIYAGQNEFKIFCEEKRTEAGYVSGYVAELIFNLDHARLIAAAPDLLEAAKVMLEWYESQPDDVIADDGSAQYLRDAIAKADGTLPDEDHEHA